MAERKRRHDGEVTASSGNVFADLNLADAEELQTKTKIAFALNTIIEKLGDLTQEQIADRLHTDQPKVSALRRYKLEGLSVERLMGFLTVLDCDIDINITPCKNPESSHTGRISVKVNAA